MEIRIFAVVGDRNIVAIKCEFPSSTLIIIFHYRFHFSAGALDQKLLLQAEKHDDGANWNELKLDSHRLDFQTIKSECDAHSMLVGKDIRSFSEQYFLV